MRITVDAGGYSVIRVMWSKTEEEVEKVCAEGRFMYLRKGPTVHVIS